ncbi:MAG: hypothetical protein ACJ8GO_02025 [Ramlibacter sp.]
MVTVMASLSYRFFEAPLLRLKTRYRSGPAAGAAVLIGMRRGAV